MTDTPSPSLARQLKVATAEAHRRVERSGVMAALLRGRIELGGYVSLMRNLHAIYAVLEPALLRHAGSAVLGPVVMPELFRAEALRRDLSWLAEGASEPPSPPAAALQPATAAYVARLREIDAGQPELLVAHAYVRYLGDLSGGQQLRRIVRQALGLADGAGTAFYDFGDAAQVNRLAQQFRAGLETAGQRAGDASVIVAEAESAFGRHGEIFEQLAAAA